METTETIINLDARSAREFSQFVCFKLADEEYAININSVNEVIRVPRITPVPQMPLFVLGVVNIRGKVIPVFDLRVKFGLKEKPYDHLTKIIVCSYKNMYLSFIIDEILDNVRLENSKIDKAPNVKMKIDKNTIKGVGLISKRMIVILDLAKVHEDIMKSISQR